MSFRDPKENILDVERKTSKINDEMRFLELEKERILRKLLLLREHLTLHIDIVNKYMDIYLVSKESHAKYSFFRSSKTRGSILWTMFLTEHN